LMNGSATTLKFFFLNNKFIKILNKGRCQIQEEGGKPKGYQSGGGRGRRPLAMTALQRCKATLNFCQAECLNKAKSS